MHLRYRIAALGFPAALLVAASGTARADLYAVTFGDTGPGLVQYNAAGQLVRRAFAGMETADGLAVTPDGWVYVAGNGVGFGTLDRARVGGPFNWQPVVSFRHDALYTIPGGLAAGPDGSVYATSTAFHGGISGVFRYNPADGSFDPVVINAAPAPVPGQLPPQNYAVALAPGGDIYLGRSGIGVERYAGATGQYLGLVVPWSAIGQRSYDIEFGPDGNLYLPTQQGIDRYNPQTGALIDRFIPKGAGGLNGATDLSFGGDGLLYVNSPEVDSILRYDAATGAFRDVFVTPAQYQLAGKFGPGQIVYVVPEPGAFAAVAGVAGGMLLRRRRAWQTQPAGARR